ncbi:glutamate-aspartate carrier protein [Planoprotostelium fungivorum]|uniref:Amino acid transporter n=1 Tax=Planoprotostelium fungivorum TaxID=1890364 RepID=A0A2P6N1L0_9EUKA|nr:glutamate-aspartate carrier protein [Planoprotostelium fungivorum]
MLRVTELREKATRTCKLVYQKCNITVCIIIAMLIGVIIGHVAPNFAVGLKPLSNVFLRMIQSLEAPLIFSTLVTGIAGHGQDLKRIGRLAIKSLVYFEVVTTFALMLGLLMVNITQPGVGIEYNRSSNTTIVPTGHSISWEGELEKIVPSSFFKAAADNEVLQIVFCAIMFAVSMFYVEEEHRNTMLKFLESLSHIMFKVVKLVMYYAPIGIGCAIAATVGKSGLGVLYNLGKLVASLYLTLLLFIICILLPIIFLARLPVREFFRAIGQPFLIAFATASSESALPKAMENMEAYGVPKKIVSFVLPTGYSFNLDGTSLYLSMATLFCAQAEQVDLSIGEQILILFTLMLTSKGVAAVPRASLIILAATVQQYGISIEPISLILGVDAFMDMARTSINVFGNCLAAAVVSKWEGEFRSAEWYQERNSEQMQSVQVRMRGASDGGSRNDYSLVT